MQFLENLVQTISAQILPTACIACQKFQTQSICNSCLNSLESNCLIHYECCNQCGIPLKRQELNEHRCNHCIKSSPLFDETHCLDRYDGILQNALHQLKYQKRIVFAHGLASTWNYIQFRRIEQCHADYLLPVPISSKKLLTRGFNQSWELARRVYCNNHVQKLPHALKRHHHVNHQAGNTLLARQDAIREMFYIDTQYLEFFKGKTVIVFDDVMTSGATLNEIARILKAIGVLRVINWVILRTTRFN
jgi:ComF family protein